MKRTDIILRTISFMTLSFLFGGCSSAPLATRLVNESLLRESQSITIKKFESRNATLNYEGNVDSLGHVMAAYVQIALAEGNSRMKASVTPGDTVRTDLIMEGRFTNIDAGSGAARILVGTGGATVAIWGVIKSKSGDIIAEFSKSKTSSGGPLGMGGLLAGNGEKIIDDSMMEIARDIAQFVSSGKK